MGKASSSKKVQRAAKAASTSRGVGESKERGFPLLVGLIILLGIGLVVAARSSRDPVSAPLLTDHWHSAYEFVDCGTVRPAIQNQTDPDGIHTHGDGLVHIHPFNSQATGTDARFGVLFDAADLSVSNQMITANNGLDAGFAPIDASEGCDGEPSEIVLARWIVDGEDGLELETVYRDDFADVRFLGDREAFVFAKVPVGEDPPEPSAAVLAQLDASTGTTNLFEEGFELPPLDGDGTDTGDDETDTDPGDDESDTDSGDDETDTDTGDDEAPAEDETPSDDEE